MNFKDFYFESFYGYKEIVNFGEKENIEIYKNATSDEIDEILKKSNGVRIGVVSPSEIYYWTSEVLHKKMEKELQKMFKLKLTYDSYGKRLEDYDAQDKQINQEWLYPQLRKDLIAEIKSTLDTIFTKIKYPPYMGIKEPEPEYADDTSEPEPQRYVSPMAQFR